MSTAGRRGPALAVAVLLSALLASPALGAGSPSPSPTTEPEDPIRVVLTSVLPRAPQPGGAVQVTGLLRNTGSRTVTDLLVRLRVGAVINTRSELQESDQDRPPTHSRVTVTPALRTLAPGQVTTFNARTTVSALRMTRIGVYPLDVVARGNAGDGLDSLGLAPTLLPYFDGTTPRPTRVAVLWPLVDVPHLNAEGKLADEDLGDLLAPTGRLGRLLAAARTAQVRSCEPPATGPDGKAAARPVRCDPVDVTFAVDPELIEAAQVLADGKEPGASVAAAWLDALRSSGLDGRVLALPYADADVSALARDRRTKDDIANAAALGVEVVRRVLSTSPVTSLAWPPAGPVDSGAADALALGEARAFVLDPSAYDDDSAPSFPTPSAASLFTTSATGAQLRALVLEPDLSDLLTRTTPYGKRVTEQRFLAETAIVAAEKPGVSRTLVLAPPRRGAVADAAAEELRDLGRVPWLCSVPLSAVGSGTESCARQSGPPDEPLDRGEVRSDSEDELAPDYLAGVTADRELGTQLTDAVLSAAPSVGPAVAALKGKLRRAVARAETSAARDDPTVALRTSGDLHDDVEKLAGQVVVRGGRSLLTSTKGRLSVSVENTLPLPVQVRVRFTSKTATLTNAETGLVTVQPGHAVQASVQARAQRSGQFVVFARLVDRDGKSFGPETEIIVRSTRFSRVALTVTFAAFGVLLVAAGVRIAMRVRSARS
jgi:hypothetical protein